MYIRYAGDFLNDYKRIFEQQGKENYYGQKYSIEMVLQQAESGLDILDLSLNVDVAYDEIIKHSIRVIGLNNDAQSVPKIIDTFSPDKVILRIPDVTLLKHLRYRKISTFPIFADSFGRKPWYRLRSTLNRLKLSRELMHHSIEWVGNHQINASKSLMAIGVPANKILPYDWLHDDLPENWRKASKTSVGKQVIQLFYAGQLSRIKGLYDLIDAVFFIKKQNRKIKLVVAGKITDELSTYIQQKNLQGEIELLGLVDHENVLQQMHNAHAVIVPSHHSYPEGLPMTIMEGLLTNTPVIASDHPMFIGRCDKHGAVLFFEQQNSTDLAEKILYLMRDDHRYNAIQKNTVKEWHNLCLDLKFADMVNHWISNSTSDLFKKSSLDNYLV